MEVIKKGSTYVSGHYLNKDDGTTIQFYAKVNKREFLQEHGENAEEKAKQLGVKNFVDLKEEETVHIKDGTTNEELMSILVHRMSDQQKKAYSKETEKVIDNLKESLFWCKERSRDRKNMKSREN